MRIQLKKVFLISLIFIFLGCDSKNNQKITIYKLNGSPSYSNSKITSVDLNKVENEFKFSFELENYELGIQTETEFDYQHNRSLHQCPLSIIG